MCARAFLGYCKVFPMRVRDVFSGYLAAIFPPCDFAFSGLLQRFRFRSACVRFSFGLLQSFSLCVRAIFIFISDYCCKVYRRVCMLFSDCLMQSFFLCTCVFFSSRAVAKFIVVLACF